MEVMAELNSHCICMKKSGKHLRNAVENWSSHGEGIIKFSLILIIPIPSQC